MVATCTFGTCTNKLLVWGLCSTHYDRTKKFGAPDGIPPEVACSVCSAIFQPSRGGTLYCGEPCSRKAQAARIKICSVNDCGTKSRYHGMCEKHAHKEYRHKIVGIGACEWCTKTFEKTRLNHRFCTKSCGSYWVRKNKPPKRTRATELSLALDTGDDAQILAAIRARVEIAPSGCWTWPVLTQHGYPTCSHRGIRLSVHRVALEAFRGAKLGNMQAHHICANTACVNPAHLEPATRRENVSEMLERRGLKLRISMLEKALIDLSPDHPLLKWSDDRQVRPATPAA